MSIFFVLTIQLFLFVILLGFGYYFLSMLVSDFFGVPFVPTRQKALADIFDNLMFSPKDVFFDLGSGDGRLVFYIAKKYNIKAYGVELNPLLHFACKLKKKLFGHKSAFFIRKNALNVNLKKATVIYLFLFPEITNKLYKKIKRQCKAKTVIISHGFRIKTLKGKEKLVLEKKPFSTYFYQLPAA